MSASVYFPERLKALREAIGISQEELAKALGISRASIGYYESAQRTPDIDILDRINQLTGCSVHFLLGYTANMREDFDGYDAYNLNDAALNALDKMRSPIPAYIISHQKFPSLIELLQALPHLRRGGLKTDGLGGTESYALFLISQTFQQIVTDYQKMCERTTGGWEEEDGGYFEMITRGDELSLGLIQAKIEQEKANQSADDKTEAETEPHARDYWFKTTDNEKINAFYKRMVCRLNEDKKDSGSSSSKT